MVASIHVKEGLLLGYLIKLSEKKEAEGRKSFRSWSRSRNYGLCWVLKTEANQMRTQWVHIKRVLPWLVPRARRVGTRDFCTAVAALVGPVENIFFLSVRVHYFTSFVPIAQQAELGRQSCRVTCLLICVSLHINSLNVTHRWMERGGGENFCANKAEFLPLWIFLRTPFLGILCQLFRIPNLM